ncbi:HTH-type transcriptional activator AllS [Pigmentiphaga humi]|uniref:HTH-type transcriptional activator AllS n=1 Tax=Pigmentiphaga humi TaxID=2478468 RepID=A0A3P4AZN2_9BURK|nr:LysR family transcriptional regulator [Pigmentiphaga humi]VCU68940.1 HTH-type transcriptional activator AllS [Pigmentiphaga humi]
MAYSLEALAAFTQAAALGSFSAAARKLGKRQSSISESIANLEIDLGVQLFDRGTRQPTLTPAGQALLVEAAQVLSSAERLGRAAGRFAAGQESRLTLALSDTYQSERFEVVLTALDRRYPGLEFECMMSEDWDTVATVQRGRADLGLLRAQESYPPDIEHTTLPELSEMVLAVGRSHPLARLDRVTQADLRAARELRIAPYEEDGRRIARGHSWSAPYYLMLLEMAAMGFGWARLPRWLLTRFAADTLVELDVPGQRRLLPLDLVWSNRRPLGPAGAWLLEEFLKA